MPTHENRLHMHWCEWLRKRENITSSSQTRSHRAAPAHSSVWLSQGQAMYFVM